MRIIHKEERRKRGCIYCADVIPANMDWHKAKRLKCPYKKCPYHETDEFETYADYMKVNGGKWISLIRKGLGIK